MKEEQKVYIKGNPNRGDEVIKALTDLGGVNSWSYAGTDEKALYYINPIGNIEYIYDYEFLPECLLVKEFYREIELPEIKNWEDGDLLVRWCEGKKVYSVYSDEKTKIDDWILSYVYVCDKGYDTMVISDTKGFKSASMNDTKEFQKLLHKKGKEWDFENKKLIDWKWKP